MPKSPRKLPGLAFVPQLPNREHEVDDVQENPFKMDATGYTPRPEESVEESLRNKMRDFVLQTGGGWASVDLRRIHEGPALIPEGVITIGNRKHVIQRGPPKAIARILHRLNRKRTIVTRYFANQTVNKWKMTLLYIIFKAWAGIAHSRPKSVESMLAFIARSRGRGARFWFERWLKSHASRRYENLKIAENKFKMEYRMRLLDIETKSMEAEQVNGLVAKDLRATKEKIETQLVDLERLTLREKELESELNEALEKLHRLEKLINSPDIYVGQRIDAATSEWTRSSLDQYKTNLNSIERIINGLRKRSWQDARLASHLNEDAKIIAAKREQNAMQLLNTVSSTNEENDITSPGLGELSGENAISEQKLRKPPTRADRSLGLIRRWFSVLTIRSVENISIPGDLRDGNLWAKALDYLSQVSPFQEAFSRAKYIEKAAEEKRRKNRLAIVIKNLRRLGIYVPRLARTPAGFLEASDEIHLSIASETMCKYPGVFSDTAPLVKLEKNHRSLLESWRILIKLHEILEARLEMQRRIKNPADIDEMYIASLKKSAKEFFEAAEMFRDDISQLTKEAYALERSRKGNERRMLQVELSTSMEDSSRLLKHVEELQDQNSRQNNDEGDGAISAEDELRDLKRYSKIPWPWLNGRDPKILTVEIRNEITISLTSLSVGARRLFRYYAVGKERQKLTIDGFFEIVHDAGLLKVIGAHMLEKIFWASVDSIEGNRAKWEGKPLFQYKQKYRTDVTEHDPYKLIVDQFLAVVRNRGHRSLFGHKINSLKDLFKAMDLNYNHALSNSEFREACKRLDIRITENQLQHLLEEMRKADGHMRVSYRGFVRSMRKHHPELMELEDVHFDESGGRRGEDKKEKRDYAAAEDFVEIMLLLSEIIMPHLDVADGLQVVWDEYLSECCPVRASWNSVRRFVHSNGIAEILNSRRNELQAVFSALALPSTFTLTHVTIKKLDRDFVGQVISREIFFKICSMWGLLRRGIPPGDINLVFAHASGAWEFSTLRRRETFMVFPQFLTAVVGMFLRGGVDPFIDARRSLRGYIDEQLLQVPPLPSVKDQTMAR